MNLNDIQNIATAGVAGQLTTQQYNRALVVLKNNIEAHKMWLRQGNLAELPKIKELQKTLNKIRHDKYQYKTRHQLSTRPHPARAPL